MAEQERPQTVTLLIRTDETGQRTVTVTEHGYAPKPPAAETMPESDAPLLPIGAR